MLFPRSQLTCHTFKLTTQCKPATPSLHLLQNYYLHILIIVCIHVSIDDFVYLLPSQPEHEFPKKRSSSLSRHTQVLAPGQLQVFGKHLMKEVRKDSRRYSRIEPFCQSNRSPGLHSSTVPDLMTLGNWVPVSN